MKPYLYLACLLISIFTGHSQDLKPFELTDEWTNSIVSKLPNDYPKLEVKKNILIFSLFTGFDHWTVPHTEAVIEGIAERSGNFKITTSNDIEMFNEENILEFDAIILNNNCSQRDNRNIFFDVFKEDESIATDEAWSKAEQYEKRLLDYIRKGNGLVVLHGGITMLNKSKQFSEMMGGSFDYHPKQQVIQVKLTDKKHTLLKGFKGKGFEHIDEPYFFDNAYFNYDFKPLLYMEADKIEGKNKEIEENIQYLAWIKKYGKGRVFYASPSHNPQSYENPGLLSFFLNGILYATGGLQCDDSSLKL
ncbi:ThuA domain-containing protein [Maribacter sp. PR1]|uniref:ThuA domain-containing protein n=1 Tax=Maribacter cobaltidurans TaxID=1178778 RepID=A0ABU7IWD1_9FLAO|nr:MULTISPECIES: ThuA domain-containing protein [Maribacter]MDC6389902.1 ThuA domain-containing protein [Maribacter sp. PR1]MEE1977292.1 ThuA domain-containing protein [Maribacter cobaltidurans]